MSQDINYDKIQILKLREQYRDDYWIRKDPICNERLLWRAQIFRHLVHLLPGQTILEIGSGKGLFTSKLLDVSRKENKIVSATFNNSRPKNHEDSSLVDIYMLSSLPGELQGKTFDLIVSYDLLDDSNYDYLLKNVYDFLKPGGKVIFFESNPWNPYYNLRSFFQRLLGKKDPRRLLSRLDLYELISSIGFVGIFSVHNDFVYRPIPKSLMWFFRNISIILENTPFLRTLSGAIIVHAQKPPINRISSSVSLFEHEELRNSISVVIPCHNEEMNIEGIVSQLISFYKQYLYEIILVDDNSTDNTRKVIGDLASKNRLIRPLYRKPPNGVGLALRDGYQVASGKYVLSMDCDFLQILPEMRDIFDAAAEGYDVVIGSRFSRNSILLNYPLNKIIANRGFHLLAQLLLFKKFRDLTNNLKLMKKEVVDNLNLEQKGFAVNAETGIQPLIKGYKIIEVPISWINRDTHMGVSSFRLLEFGVGYVSVLAKSLYNKLVNWHA